MSAKRKNPRGWDAQEASQASFQREVESRRRDPYATLQEALDFTENLLAVAVQCIKEAQACVKAAETPEDAEHWQGERTLWTGVRLACDAIRTGTTIPR
jgi:hypothetical protein